MTAPILWWKGENNPVESVNGVNAVWSIDMPPYGETLPNYATGVVGNCFRILAGEGETYVKVGLFTPNNALFNFAPAASFSIRCSIKLDLDNTYLEWIGCPIISKGEPFVMNPLNSDYSSDWGIFIDGDTYALSVVTGINSTRRASSYIISDSNFHDVLMTYNNGVFALYVDGVDRTGTINSGGPYSIRNTIRPLVFVGSAPSIGADLYLDEVRIYDQVIVVDNDDTPTPNTKLVQFVNNTQGGADTYDLDFGDGSAHGTSFPITHEYNLDAIGAPYKVNVTLTVRNGRFSNSLTKELDLLDNISILESPDDYIVESPDETITLK